MQIYALLRKDPTKTFDAEQPVESQMAPVSDAPDRLAGYAQSPY